jgi:hypothetical protein
MDGDATKKQVRFKQQPESQLKSNMDMDVDDASNSSKGLNQASIVDDDDDATQVDDGEEQGDSDADDSVDNMSTSQSPEETDEENSNWIKPSSTRPKMTLSLFGKLWMVMDRLRTAQTGEWVRNPGMEIEGLKLDSTSLMRMNLFSKKIFAAYAKFLYGVY